MIPTIEDLRNALKAYRETRDAEETAYNEYLKMEERTPTVSNREKARILYKEWQEKKQPFIQAKNAFETMALAYAIHVADNPKESS